MAFSSCKLRRLLYIYMLLSTYLSSVTAGDTFSSLVHLMESIQAEKDIVTHLDDYVQTERKRLDQIESLMREITSHHEDVSSGNLERHLSNPVNAFRVTISMHQLLNRSMSLVEESSKRNVEGFVSQSSSTQSSLPSKDDVDGAVLALLRLQDTYELNTSQLSDGRLGLREQSSEAPPLSGDDCSEIGRTAFFMDDFYHSIMWFQRALEKYDDLAASGQNMSQKITKTLDFLNFGLYKQGNIERAIAAADRWVSMEPGAEPGNKNLVHYHRMLNDENITYDASKLPPLKNIRKRKGFSNTTDFKLYEKLCQGRTDSSLWPEKDLVCQNEPILNSYYPAKVEVLSLSPRLVYFHHVISDAEVEKIKSLAKPKLERSGVFASNAETPAGGIKTHNRVSKSAWLWDSESDVIASLSERFSRVTGLTIDYAESLQVLNYGIGGHYEPHCDFARSDNPNVFEKGAGNRLATFIIYLTDVEMGGATVFPKVGATVWPEKGGAAFWYNIKPDGSLDERTLHGACPVLVGYKWVCNKWFHESGNEFTRPCPLE